MTEDGRIIGRNPGRGYASQFATNLESSSPQVKARFAELMAADPELARGQAYVQAMIEERDRKKTLVKVAGGGG